MCIGFVTLASSSNIDKGVERLQKLQDKGFAEYNWYGFGTFNSAKCESKPDQRFITSFGPSVAVVRKRLFLFDIRRQKGGLCIKIDHVKLIDCTGAGILIPKSWLFNSGARLNLGYGGSLGNHRPYETASTQAQGLSVISLTGI